jgi:Tfp pilus assembly protein PilN
MIRINLLKPEKKEIREVPSVGPPEIREKKKMAYYPLIYLLLIVACVALFFNQKSTLSREQNLLEKAQQEKQAFKDIETKLQKLENQKTILERKITLINSLKSVQDRSVRIMDEISKNIPDWVWLTELNFNGTIIEVKGRALSNNLIADYIDNLEKSPYFNDVELISSTQRRTQADRFMEFSLTLNYTIPGPAPQGEENQKGEKK